MSGGGFHSVSILVSFMGNAIPVFRSSIRVGSKAPSLGSTADLFRVVQIYIDPSIGGLVEN
jgi:hypothetical protein